MSTASWGHFKDRIAYAINFFNGYLIPEIMNDLFSLSYENVKVILLGVVIRTVSVVKVCHWSAVVELEPGPAQF